MSSVSQDGKINEGKSIYEFTKGDYIIRLKSALRIDTKTNENLGIEMQVIEGVDNSFREEPKELIGIYNNLIYLRSIKPSYSGAKLFVHKLRLEMYEEDWALFEIPEGLTIDDCIF